ncbi:MAG: amidase [Deltaproteobacteria bacterium]|nr:MAG: amidase [Deltaproteobacteria bacterium]
MPFAEFENYDAVGLAELVRAGEVSPAELVEAAIARVEARNPELNAVVHTMFEQARQAVSQGLPEGPMRGVPFLLKDLHADVAGHPTTAGSALSEGLLASEDSTLVERYRRAGLVLLGKTNVPELGIMGVTESRHLGPARNPWNPDHTPGGSSGGAAAAVAARMVPVAHASDGGGSIRIPASHCGLVGLKPSRARTPSGPLHGPGWGGLSVEHVVSRTVRDSAALLDASHGSEPGAPYQVVPPDRPFLDEVGVDPGKLRIAFTPRALLAGEAHGDCVTAVERAATMLSELGHEVEIAEPTFDPIALRRAYFGYVACGVAGDLQALARRQGRAASPSDVEPTTWVFNQIGHALRGADVEQHHRAAHALGFSLAAFFGTYDLWLTATCARPPARVGELYPDASKERLMKALRFVGTRTVLLSALDRLAAEALSATPNTQLANLSGIPAISIPLHRNGAGMPVGVQLMAPLGAEARLLRVASQLEVAHPWIDATPVLKEVP